MYLSDHTILPILLYAGISIRASTRRYVTTSNEWNRRFDC